MSDSKGDGFGEGPKDFGPVYGSRFGGKEKPPARADFKKWARRDLWHIVEGAMLILGFEPFDVKAHSWPKGPEGFDDIYETAIRSLNNEVLRASPTHWVSPSDFLAWAREKEYPIPERLEELVNQFHPNAEGGQKETPAQRSERVRARHKKLEADGDPHPTKTIAEEEKISARRVRQVMENK